MLISIKNAGALSAALLICTSVAAQTAARPDPLNANAVVPRLTYQSSFANYRSVGDDAKPLSWREANEAAARIGGWRVYAREAQEPSPDPAPASVPVPAPVPQPAPAVIAPPAPAASSATPSNAHQHHKP